MKRTSRGFAIYGEVKDTRGHTVRIQKSSAVSVGNANGFKNGPFVWLFVSDDQGAHWQPTTAVGFNGVDVHTPHLTRAQARRVAKALMKFADGDE
jgi:hypothetical protein